MAVEVEVNGTILEFPDGTTKDQVIKYLKKQKQEMNSTAKGGNQQLPKKEEESFKDMAIKSSLAGLQKVGETAFITGGGLLSALGAKDTGEELFSLAEKSIKERTSPEGITSIDREQHGIPATIAAGLLENAVGFLPGIGPAVAATSAGTTTSAEQLMQGKDLKTSELMGLTSGLTTYLGSKLPNKTNVTGKVIPDVAKHVALGAAGNVATGIPQRALQREILEAGGYDKNEVPEALDPKALAIDIGSGIPFGASAYLSNKAKYNADQNIQQQFISKKVEALKNQDFDSYKQLYRDVPEERIREIFYNELGFNKDQINSYENRDISIPYNKVEDVKDNLSLVPENKEVFGNEIQMENMNEALLNAKLKDSNLRLEDKPYNYENPIEYESSTLDKNNLRLADDSTEGLDFKRNEILSTLLDAKLKESKLSIEDNPIKEQLQLDLLPENIPRYNVQESNDPLQLDLFLNNDIYYDPKIRSENNLIDLVYPEAKQIIENNSSTKDVNNLNQLEFYSAQQVNEGIKWFEINPTKGKIKELNIQDRLELQPSESGSMIIEQEANGKINVIRNNDVTLNDSTYIKTNELLNKTGPIIKKQAGMIDMFASTKWKDIKEADQAFGKISKDKWINKVTNDLNYSKPVAETLYKHLAKDIKPIDLNRVEQDVKSLGGKEIGKLLVKHDSRSFEEASGDFLKEGDWDSTKTFMALEGKQQAEFSRSPIIHWFTGKLSDISTANRDFISKLTYGVEYNKGILLSGAKYSKDAPLPKLESTFNNTKGLNEFFNKVTSLRRLQADHALSESELIQQGFNPKEAEVYSGLRNTFDTIWNSISDKYKALGRESELPKFDPNYFPMKPEGNFLIQVLGKDGNNVSQVVFKTRAEALSFIKNQEVLLNEHLGLTPDQYFRANDKHIKRINEYQDLSQTRYFISPSAGSGAKGNLMEASAYNLTFLGKDSGKQTLKYLKTHFSKMEALLNSLDTQLLMREVKQNTKVTNALPNKVDYITRLANNFRQLPEDRLKMFTKAVESPWSVPILKDYFNAGDTQKAFRTFGFMFSSLKVAGNTVNYIKNNTIQVYMSLPARLQLIKSVEGIKESASIAMLKAHVGMLIPNAEDTKSLKWAVENHVIDQTSIEMFTNHIGKDINVNKVAWHFNKYASIGERYGRTLAWLTLNNMLKNTIPDPEVRYKTAARQVNLSMVDMSRTGEIGMYSEAGALGAVTSPLKTFMHNDIGQFLTYLKYATNEKEYKPILAYMGAKLAFGGLLATPFLKDANVISNFLNQYLDDDNQLPMIEDMLAKDKDSGVSPYLVFGIPTGLTSTYLEEGYNLGAGLEGSSLMDATGMPTIKWLSDIAANTVDIVKYKDIEATQKLMRNLAPGIMTNTLDVEFAKEHTPYEELRRTTGMDSRGMASSVPLQDSAFSQLTNFKNLSFYSEGAKDRLVSTKARQWEAKNSKMITSAARYLYEGKEEEFINEVNKIQEHYLSIGEVKSIKEITTSIENSLMNKTIPKNIRDLEKDDAKKYYRMKTMENNNE